MTTFDDITSGTGIGGFDFRLEVEGWPCEWVNNPRITHATGKDGRAVLGGLDYEPFHTRERIVMHMAELQCDGMQFRMKPPHEIVSGLLTTDEDIYYLANEKDPIDKLAVALAHDDTTIELLSGSTYAIGTVLHIGTEAVRVVGADNEIERAIWGTQPQAHPIDSYSRQFDIYVYLDFPPTMEGRRVTLYGYGEADDVAGDGTVLWRGMLAIPPQLWSDGKSWVLDCEPVTHVLSQSIAGAVAQAGVIGIYHHYASPFVLMVHYDGDDYGPFYYSGHDLNEEVMFQNITAFLDSAVRVQTPASGIISAGGIDIRKMLDGQLVIYVKHNGSTPVPFHLVGGSAVLGFFHTQLDGWQDSGPSLVTAGGAAGHLTKKILRQSGLIANAEAYVELTSNNPHFAAIAVDYQYSGAPVMALGTANLLIKASAAFATFVGLGVGSGPTSTWIDPRTVAIQYSPWRIYVDTDLTGIETVYIRGTTKPDGLYRIFDTGVDTNKFWIEVEQARGTPTFGTLGGAASPSASGFLGYIGSEPIDSLRRYALGSVVEFVAGLKTVGRDFANTGDAPFITDADLETFATTGVLSPLALLRVYAFTKKVSVYDALREEIKFVGHFLRIGPDGRIGIAPLPRWTETTPVDALHTIGGESIITPPSPGGMWPSHKPNDDGRVTQVVVKHFFSFRENEHVDKGVTVASPQTIPITKSRGKTEHSILPLSAPVFYNANAANDAELTAIAKLVLDYFSINYTLVTFVVPYNKWAILCGDIVAITSPHILAGDGTRGVTGRHGIVIEKRCNWDPAREARLEMTVMLTSRSAVGYAPSAYPTEAVDLGSDLWAFICPSTDPLNVLLSTDLDGQVLRHFAVGDFVRIIGIDSYAPFELTGIVAFVEIGAAGAETIYIAFDDTFDPDLIEGGPELGESFIIEFQVDDGATATTAQRKYCYVSSITGQAPDGSSYARRFG